MGLIADKCFERPWFEKIQSTYDGLSPELLETTTYAFELLAELVKKDLPLVFKGGTAMLLLLDNFRRLSIDVDVALPLTPDEVQPVLEAVSTDSRFIDVQPLPRDPQRRPKRHHYIFHYPSVFTDHPGSLQLDILEDNAHYADFHEVPIYHSLFEVKEEIRVNMPTAEGLLGDKLTAFAPTTVGIPYDSSKSGIRIAKQICDIGELFNHIADIASVKTNYKQFVKAENSYRDQTYPPDQIGRDRVAASEKLCLLYTNQHPVQDNDAEILEAGIRQIASHIVGRPYTFDNAKVAAAKAAALTAILSQKDDLGVPNVEDIHYSKDKIDVLKNAQLSKPYEQLNNIKSGNAEAFYYWTIVEKYLPRR